MIQIIRRRLLLFKSLTLSEFDSCQSKVCSVRRNLARCYQEWEKIGASGFILSVINDEYKIPFIYFPPLRSAQTMAQH